MANKIKYIYSNQVANKLPGSNQNYYFRTVTGYYIDNNGNPTGEAVTGVFYTAIPGGRSSDGSVWKNGSADSLDELNQGGWSLAAETSDRGKTYKFLTYSQEDKDNGRIPTGKNVGDPILGATAQQSLSTSGGVFYETIQNALINTAANTQPGLAAVVSAKQSNAAQSQSQTQTLPPTAVPSTPPQDQIDRQNVDSAVDNPITITSISQEKIGDTIGRTSFKSYYYPLELQSNKQDRIIFTLKEIRGSTINPTFDPNKKVIDRSNNLKTINGSVTLPIQSGITDSNTVDWSGSTLNAVQAYAAGASLRLMESEDASELGNNVSRILGKISEKFKNDQAYGDALKLYLAQEAVGIQGLLSRASGSILNPNLELLFNGPQLRPFNFTFRLSPREESEATQVRSIIRFFKEAMSVKTSSSNVFLKSPFVFDIKYIAYNNDGVELTHPSISRIKTCALLGCDVDYTPEGSYMTFNDDNRTMTSYQLSLRFSELEPIYSNDYTDNKILTDHIGY